MSLCNIEIDAKDLSIRDVNSKIREAIEKNLKVRIKNAHHIHGLAAGITKGEVEVDGDVGDYVAMLIGTREQKERGESGPKIIINGNVGNYLADGVWAGEVIVKGCVGYGASIYAYGGTIVIYGDAGDALAHLLKGATVVVKGNAGNNIGLYMVNGTIVIVGNAGEAIEEWMIRGEIFIGGNYKSLGHNAQEKPLTEEDKEKLKTLFTKYGIEADISKFRKIVPIKVRPFYG